MSMTKKKRDLGFRLMMGKSPGQAAYPCRKAILAVAKLLKKLQTGNVAVSFIIPAPGQRLLDRRQQRR